MRIAKDTLKKPKCCQICKCGEFNASFRYKQRGPYSKVEEIYDEHCKQCGNLVYGYSRISSIENKTYTSSGADGDRGNNAV